MNTDSLIDAVGWTLLHFIWQGVAVGLVLTLPARSAMRRYGVLVLALLLLAVLAVGTFGWEVARYEASVESESLLSCLPDTINESKTSLHPPTPNSTQDDIQRTGQIISSPFVTSKQSLSNEPNAVAWKAPYIESILQRGPSWMARAWLVGLIICSMRLLWQWLSLRNIVHSSVPLANDSTWTERMEKLAKRLEIRVRVQLRISQRIFVPLAAGVLRPMIIVPMTMLTSLPASQIETLLLHELAHIRRNDYVVNLFQIFMETVFFFHPVVWWISRAIRTEREFCCDAMVSRECDDVTVYVGALANLEEFRSRRSLVFATAADGGKEGSLLCRVERLLGVQHSTDPRRFGFLPLLLVVVVGSAALLLPQNTILEKPLAAPSPIPLDGDDKEEANVNWSNLQVADYAGEGKHVVVLHTDEAIVAVVIATPPAEWKSQKVQSGVSTLVERPQTVTAFADLTFDTAHLRVDFSSEQPMYLERSLGEQDWMKRPRRDRLITLPFGRVLYWDMNTNHIEQRVDLAEPLPEIGNLEAELLKTLQSVRKRVEDQFTAKFDHPIVAKVPSRRLLANGVTLEIERHLYHAADLSTAAILHWPASELESARYASLSVAADFFANRVPWIVVSEPSEPILWIVIGEPNGPRDSLADEPSKATSVTKVDFRDSKRIVLRHYNGWPQADDSSPCRNAVEAQFKISLTTQTPYRSYQYAIPGKVAPVENWRQIPVYLDPAGQVRVGVNETAGTFNSLQEMLSRAVTDEQEKWDAWLRSMEPTQRNAILTTPPIPHVYIYAFPELPEERVDEVIRMCDALGMGPRGHHAVNISLP